MIFLSLRFCPKFCFQILRWNFGFSKQRSVCTFPSTLHILVCTTTKIVLSHIIKFYTRLLCQTHGYFQNSEIRKWVFVKLHLIETLRWMFDTQHNWIQYSANIYDSSTLVSWYPTLVGTIECTIHVPNLNWTFKNFF